MSNNQDEQRATDAVFELDMDALKSVWAAARVTDSTSNQNVAALLQAFFAASPSEFDELSKLKERADDVDSKKNNLSPLDQRISDKEANDQLGDINRRAEKLVLREGNGGGDESYITDIIDNQTIDSERVELSSLGAEEFLQDQEDSIRREIFKMMAGAMARKNR